MTSDRIVDSVDALAARVRDRAMVALPPATSGVSLAPTAAPIPRPLGRAAWPDSG